MEIRKRSNKSLDGKNRVFLAFHPDDKNKYCDDAVRRILKVCNCVVFYTSDNENDLNDDNYSDLLSDISLFVFIITPQILSEPCIAIEKILTFAKKKYKAILPLAYEEFSDYSFSRVFGNLQYLSPYDADDTAISFEKKFSDYFKHIFFSDELINDIRNAFDATIFLSYRKIDRKYANELMRLIHSSKALYDVAIWYDEYLVPGEDYNKNIESAIKESDLFILLVTNKLLEKGNYVIQSEYPQAKHLKKKIFSALADIINSSEFDIDEYTKCFEGAPEPVNFSNVLFTEYIQEALKSVLNADNDNDPMHNFFLGLAYLTGIFVEADTEKAIKLITYAADAEIPEAADKISDLYYVGLGVSQNINESIKWKYDAVNFTVKKYDANNEKDTLLMVLRYNEELIEMLINEGRADDAEQANDSYLDSAVILEEYDCFSFMKLCIHRYFLFSARIEELKGDNIGEETGYMLAIYECKDLLSTEYRNEYETNKAYALMRIDQLTNADIHVPNIFFLTSPKMLLAKLKIKYEIRKLKKRQQLRINESGKENTKVSYIESICFNLKREYRLDETVKYYIKLKEIRINDMNETHDESSILELAECCVNYAEVLVDLGNLSDAEMELAFAYELLNDDIIIDSNVRRLNLLAEYYNLYGRIYSDRCEYSNAEECYNLIMELVDGSLEDNENYFNTILMCRCLIDNGMVKLHMNEFSEATDSFQRCIAISEKENFITSEKSIFSNLAEEGLGLIEEVQGKNDKAADHYLTANLETGIERLIRSISVKEYIIGYRIKMRYGVANLKNDRINDILGKKSLSKAIKKMRRIWERTESRYAGQALSEGLIKEYLYRFPHENEKINQAISLLSILNKKFPEILEYKIQLEQAKQLNLPDHLIEEDKEIIKNKKKLRRFWPMLPFLPILIVFGFVLLLIKKIKGKDDHPQP